MAEDEMYEDKSVRDIAIGLDKDVKYIKKQLFGNGHPGLLERVRSNEFVILRHSVYFTIIGAALVFIGACITGWVK